MKNIIKIQSLLLAVALLVPLWSRSETYQQWEADTESEGRENFDACNALWVQEGRPNNKTCAKYAGNASGHTVWQTFYCDGSNNKCS